MTEKRGEPRVAKGPLHFFPLVLDSGAKFLFGVENISTTGLLVRILDPEAPVLPEAGDGASFADCPEDLRKAFRDIREIIISDFPAPLRRALLDRQGQVVWRKGEFCGVRFDPPLELTTEILRQIMETIHVDGEPLSFEEFGGASETPGGPSHAGL